MVLRSVLSATLSRQLILLFFTAAVLLTFTGESAALHAVMYDGTSVTLHWTAPGDDGDIGQSSIYDMRCSTEKYGADTAAWWDAAEPCPGIQLPSQSGTTESFTVLGLESDSTYYFAIKAADDAGNWSEISNIYSTAYFDCADINADSNVNLLDVIYLMNYFYRGGPPPPHPENSDVNYDGSLNLMDGTFIINYLYKDGAPPQCGK